MMRSLRKSRLLLVVLTVALACGAFLSVPATARAYDTCYFVQERFCYYDTGGWCHFACGWDCGDDTSGQVLWCENEGEICC
jgi:hypothetical protein